MLPLNICLTCKYMKFLVISYELSQQIIKNVSSGIARETKFYLAELTQEKLMWNYTYSNGNTDTWTFYRQEK